VTASVRSESGSAPPNADAIGTGRPPDGDGVESKTALYRYSIPQTRGLVTTGYEFRLAAAASERLGGSGPARPGEPGTICLSVVESDLKPRGLATGPNFLTYLTVWVMLIGV
jgi:hypothetical protein